MMTRWLFPAALAAILIATGCNPREATNVSAAVKPDKERKTAPDFALKDSNGQILKLSSLKGKVILLNFWATWCGPCKIEIPWFVDFEQRYRDQGFAVVGVSMDEDGWDTVKPYITDKKVNYRVVIGNDMVAQLYGGVESLPTTFLLDRDGRIASTHVGLVSKGDYEKEIIQLLGRKAAGTPAAGLFAALAPFAAGGAR
jgi:peroxiredoxin